MLWSTSRKTRTSHCWHTGTHTYPHTAQKTNIIIVKFVVAVWRKQTQTQTKGNALRADRFLKHSHSPCHFCSLGTIPRKQPSFVSLCSHGWFSSLWFVTSAARQLIQLITEQPQLWQHRLTPPWPLTSDILCSGGLHQSLLHPNTPFNPVSVLDSNHSYSLSTRGTLMKRPEEKTERKEQSVPSVKQIGGT